MRIAHAPARSYPFGEAYALAFTTWLHLYRRDGQTAQKHAEAVIALSHKQGFPYWTAMATIFRSKALAEQEQLEEGITQMQHGLTAWQDMEAKTNLPYYLALLAETYSKKGWAEKGLTLIAEALEEIDRIGERFYEAELYRLKGELTLQSKQVSGKSQTSLKKSEASNTQHLAPTRRRKPKPAFTKPSKSLAARGRRCGNCGQ